MRRIVAAGLLFALVVWTSCAFAETTIYYQAEGMQEKKIAITVDDCIYASGLNSILDMAQEYGMSITFFPNGQNMRDNPEVFQRMVAEGHEIANHCQNHRNLLRKTDEVIARQLHQMEITTQEVLGFPYKITMMRPPFGNGAYRTSPSYIAEQIGKAGYEYIIMWSIDSTREKTVLSRVEPGSILLFHSDKQDVACLREVLPLLVEQGYEFVTVSELLGIPGCAPVPEEEWANYPLGSTTTYVTWGETTKLHLGTDPKQTVITTLSKGTEIEVLRMENDWAHVLYEGKVYYCAAGALRKK